MELRDHLFKQAGLAEAATKLGKAVAKAEGSRLLAARRMGCWKPVSSSWTRRAKHCAPARLLPGTPLAKICQPSRHCARPFASSRRRCGNVLKRKHGRTRSRVWTGPRWRTLHWRIEWSSTRTPLRT